MDMWTELQKQEQQSDAARLARAKTGSSSEVRERLASFVRAGATQQERDVRIILAEGSIREIVAANAEANDVDAETVYEAVVAKLAADTAVTKPETQKIDKSIGGEEGKKFQDTKEGPKVDGKTDTSELKPVVENPVRHKEETVTLDTQADSKPGKGTGSSDSKSFPNHASSTHKTASNPTYGVLIRWLQDSTDPSEEVYPGFLDDFMAEYQSTPEQFDDDLGYE